jgi:hypothetical protein
MCYETSTPPTGLHLPERRGDVTTTGARSLAHVGHTRRSRAWARHACVYVHRKEVVLHSRAIGMVTVMARAESEADCRMVLETRHDYGDLDADENVIVKASGLAVVKELSIRCAVQRLFSEERFPLTVHPRSRLRTADGVPATQESAAHS